MFKARKILAIIPARGGSKGIPHKNIIDLCGKPLISYTIESALNSKYIDYVMVSTDDNEIADIARKYGAEVPFMRPDELATDTSKTIDAILHAVDALLQMKKRYDELVLLQPTAPLRTTEDIDKAIELYYENNKQSVASVSKVEDHPLLIRSIENDRAINLLDINSTCRRQDMPEYYRVNGAIYINPITELSKYTSFNDNPIPYVMEKSHSIDIDDVVDLVVAEYYLRK